MQVRLPGGLLPEAGRGHGAPGPNVRPVRHRHSRHGGGGQRSHAHLPVGRRHEGEGVLDIIQGSTMKRRGIFAV